jgi:hypothetical protein
MQKKSTDFSEEICVICVICGFYALAFVPTWMAIVPNMNNR